MHSGEIIENIVEGLYAFDANAIPAFNGIYARHDEVRSQERDFVVDILNNMVERKGTEAIDVAPTLVSSLAYRYYPSQHKTVQSLVILGGSALPELIKGLSNDNTDVRYYCAVALGRIGPDACEAGPALILVLDDPVSKVRAAARHALDEIGVPFKYSPSSSQRIYDLIDGLGDSNAVVRAASAEALGNLGSEAEAALPSLQQALKDPNEGVRLAAEEAIKKSKMPLNDLLGQLMFKPFCRG
jgi:HEAT repeat protein